MKRAVVLAAVSILFFCAIACAQEVKTIKGEVIDISCYVSSGAKGAEHQACALACIQAGEPAGILEDGTGKIYTVITADHSSPSVKIMPYVAKVVEVTGTVAERGGVSTIEIKDIKEMAAAPIAMKK